MSTFVSDDNLDSGACSLLNALLICRVSLQFGARTQAAAVVSLIGGVSSNLAVRK